MSRSLFKLALWVLCCIATIGVCTFVFAMLLIAEAEDTK